MNNRPIWSAYPPIGRCLVGVSAPTPTLPRSLQRNGVGGFVVDLVGVSALAINFLEKRNTYTKEGGSRKKHGANTDTPTFLRQITPYPLRRNDLGKVGVPQPTPTKHRLFLADTDQIKGVIWLTR